MTSSRSPLLFTHLLLTTILLQCSQPPRSAESLVAENGWRKTGPGGGGSTFMPLFSKNDPEKFIVRCDMTGTYLTEDGGTSYHQANFANGSSSYAYHPVDDNVIYVGSSVLHRSDDSGKTWRQIFPALDEVTRTGYSGDHATFRLSTDEHSLYPTDPGRINTIRIDPENPRMIYFTMNRYFFHSSDEGATWARMDCSSPILLLYSMETDPAAEVFLFTSEKIHIFSKKTKTLTSQDLPPALVPAFSFSAGTTKNKEQVIFYALHNENDRDPDDEFGETSMWTSHDKGQNWKPVADAIVTNRNSNLTPSYSMIACAENDAGHVYVVCNRYEEKTHDGTIYWYGALKSSNGGTTWDWVWKGGGGSGKYGVKDGQGVANLKDAWTEQAFGGEYIRLLDAGVYPKDGNIAVVTDWYRTMKTMDGGKTWKEVYSIRQEDGSFVSRGMDVTTTYGVHFDPFDSSHIAISYTDIGYHHSFNAGTSWIRSVEGVPSEWVNTCYWVVFDPEVKGKVWSVWSSLHDFPRGKMTRNPRWKDYARGGVCVSIDGGKTWKPTIEGMGFDSPATSIVIDPKSTAGNRTLYASVFSKGVFKSTDDGKTWTLKNNGIQGNTAAFELTIQDDGTLFVTISATPAHTDGKQGLDIHSGAVYKSVDGAENWIKLSVTAESGKNGGDELLFPNGIAIDPEHPQRVYLGCWADITLSDLVGGSVIRQLGGENKTLEMPGGIFRSDDAGETWKSIFDQNQYVYDVTVDPYHPGRLYCNTFNKEAWRSDDHGQTWNRIKDYDFHWGHRVIIDHNDPEKIYLTTYGSSVWHGKPEIVRSPDR